MLISQPSGKSASLELFGIIYPVLSSARLPKSRTLCAVCCGRLRWYLFAVPSAKAIFDWNLYFLRLALLAFFPHSLGSIAARSLARSTNTFLLAISRLLSLLLLLLLALGGRCRFPTFSHLISPFNHFLRHTLKNFFQRNCNSLGMTRQFSPRLRLLRRR